MKKNIFRKIGFIMLLIGIVFVFFSLRNPDFNFPWNNRNMWILYISYPFVVLILLLIPTKKY